jgi:tRNA dimethylallyltransferase
VINQKKVLVILGPTASGKSDLAIKLARKFQGELISADSRQVYRGMDVATAKLVPPRGIKQQLVSIVDPDKPYSVQRFKEDAAKAIALIHKRKKLPIVVGGTALFIDALVENWDVPQIPPDKKLRTKLERELEKHGLSHLVEKLERLDPLVSARVDAKNARRVIRAIEVASAIGNSSITGRTKKGMHYDVLKLGIQMDRTILRERIDKRVRQMMTHGLIEETRRLRRRYDLSLPSMSGIGYPEVALYLDKKISKEECIEKIVTHTYQYAKRQMTWWKRDKSIFWTDSAEEAKKLTKDWLRL